MHIFIDEIPFSSFLDEHGAKYPSDHENETDVDGGDYDAKSKTNNKKCCELE